MKINLEGVGHLLCMGERAFKLDEHLGKVRVVQYTEQWELKNNWRKEEMKDGGNYYVTLL